MPEPHKDRRAGLIVFGVLHILLGCLTLLTLLRTAAIARTNFAQAIFFDSAATLYFFATGIGSIRARRWARALAAAVSGIWTVLGVFSLALAFIVVPHVMVLIPPSQESAVKIGTFAFIAIGMILLPLVLALFYGSRDTGLTCDELDPRIRWTDRVPVPALALALVLAFVSVTMLMNAVRPNFILFGRVLTGAPAALAMIAFGILFAHLAIQVYRLRESAWWVLVLLHVLTGAASIPAFATMNLNDAYRAAGTLTPQIQAMHLEQLTGNPALWAIVAVGWTAYLAFLIWLRRYFVGRSAEAPAPVVVST